MADRRSSQRSLPVRRERKGRSDERVRSRADELSQQGMPYQMAMAVAHGRMDLNEALERMARRDRVNVLMERHDLSRALATQIALGHADLDQVLARRRLEQHRETNRDRTCLVPGEPLALVLYDGRTLRGQVADVEPYTFQFDTGSGTEEVHKLQVMYGYPPSEWKKVKKGVKVDRKAASDVDAPAVHPQDRYSCSDKRLFGYQDRAVDILVTLFDGQILRGTVSWFGRYEFGLALRTGVEVVVFRHALRDLGPATH